MSGLARCSTTICLLPSLLRGMTWRRRPDAGDSIYNEFSLPVVRPKRVHLGDRRAGRWRAPSLLDDLIGASEDRLRHGQAERVGGLQVDDQLKLGQLLHRQVGGFGALEDFS